MSEPQLEQVGIESYVVEFPSPELVRARFRIDNSGVADSAQFRPGDWLEVSVSARIFTIEQIQRERLEEPRAQGAEVRTRARTDWSVVDLSLPLLPAGEYGIVAKIYSADDRYRKPFQPSNCFVSVVEFQAP